MIKNKFILVLAVSLVLISAVFGFDAHKYFSDKESGDIKEEIEIEIMNGEGDSIEDSIEEEIEEDIIENDAEQVEVSKEQEADPEEPEEIVETPPVIPEILPLPKVKMDDLDGLRIGFITDLHVRSNSDGIGNRILKPAFVERINYFIEKMNNSFVPNFIIANGDIIEGTNASPEKGIAELSLVKKLFDRTTLKKYWVVGNHDLRSVNKNQFMQSLDIDYVSKSFETGNYKIIILDSNFKSDNSNIVPGKYYTRGHVSEKQIKLLKKELENTDKRKIVFLHHPPLWNVNGKSNNGFPDNAKKLQEIFSQNKVFAVFAGHIEDLFLQEIDGVKYFVSPGIVKNEKYQGAFSEITIKKEQLIIEMSYLKNDGSYRTIRIKED
jgi:hypothetical protein